MNLNCVSNEEYMSTKARIALTVYFENKGVDEGNEYLTYLGAFNSIKDFYLNYIISDAEPYCEDFTEFIRDGFNNDWLNVKKFVKDFLSDNEDRRGISKTDRSLRRAGNFNDEERLKAFLDTDAFDYMNKFSDSEKVDLVLDYFDFDEIESAFWDDFDRGRTPFLILEDKNNYFIWQRD